MIIVRTWNIVNLKKEIRGNLDYSKMKRGKKTSAEKIHHDSSWDDESQYSIENTFLHVCWLIFCLKIRKAE